jgi:hypothetical protein
MAWLLDEVDFDPFLARICLITVLRDQRKRVPWKLLLVRGDSVAAVDDE